MKLSDMKQVLVERDIQLTKSLGQNFLHDANQLRRIMAVAELKKTDRVLEIGPGLGPLTEILVEQVGEVLAIEKDARLVEVLKQRFQTETGGTPVLHLLHDDALDYLKREERDWSNWKMVANLPFSVMRASSASSFFTGPSSICKMPRVSPCASRGKQTYMCPSSLTCAQRRSWLRTR